LEVNLFVFDCNTERRLERVTMAMAMMTFLVFVVALDLVAVVCSSRFFFLFVCVVVCEVIAKPWQKKLALKSLRGAKNRTLSKSSELLRTLQKQSTVKRSDENNTDDNRGQTTSLPLDLLAP